MSKTGSTDAENGEKKTASEDDSSIFLPRPDGRGYKLRPEIRFHLYINTAPCGDARIFSPHEAEASESKPASNVDPHPNRKARGQLRTKIESGEGTIPVKSSDGIQTWDGVLQGSRLLTMSCSGTWGDCNGSWAYVHGNNIFLGGESTLKVMVHRG